MLFICKTLDDVILDKIHMRENTLLKDIQDRFASTYSDFLSQRGLHCEIRLHRWIDTTSSWFKRKNDGYSASIQIELEDRSHSTVELDEAVCSCFAIVSYISFLPFTGKYRVYQADDLHDLWNETEQLITRISVR